MAYQKQDFASRIVVEPKEASAWIVEWYREAKCSQKATADKIGCSEATLIRWIRILDEKGTGIRRALARAKRSALAEGWHHRRKGGRPRRSRQNSPKGKAA